jgi:hypothetical protein
VSTRVVALVASDDRSRAELCRYLEQAGFAVRVGAPTSRRRSDTRALVWLASDDRDHQKAADDVNSWLAASAARRAVIVTDRPAAFQGLRMQHGRRISILPAPVFGWQVVDALRWNRGGGTA